MVNLCHGPEQRVDLFDARNIRILLVAADAAPGVAVRCAVYTAMARLPFMLCPEALCEAECLERCPPLYQYLSCRPPGLHQGLRDYIQ